MDIEDLFKDKSYQRFSKHFPRTGDLTLIVLKGHLLLEEEINDLLSQFMKNKNYIEKAKLSFYQKICLVESLLLEGSTKGTCFEIIEMINLLRNNIAHKLEPKKLEAKVRDLLYCMFPNNKVEINNTDKRIKYLELGIASLIGQLSSFVNKYKMT